MLLGIAPEHLIDCVLDIAAPDAVLSQKPLLLSGVRWQGRRSDVLLPDRRGAGAVHPDAHRVSIGGQSLSGLKLRVEASEHRQPIGIAVDHLNANAALGQIGPLIFQLKQRARRNDHRVRNCIAPTADMGSFRCDCSVVAAGGGRGTAPTLTCLNVTGAALYPEHLLAGPRGRRVCWELLTRTGGWTFEEPPELAGVSRPWPPR